VVPIQFKDYSSRLGGMELESLGFKPCTCVGGMRWRTKLHVEELPSQPFGDPERRPLQSDDCPRGKQLVTSRGLQMSYS
jgi:hypothetical protein